MAFILAQAFALFLIKSVLVVTYLALTVYLRLTKKQKKFRFLYDIAFVFVVATIVLFTWVNF